MKYRKKPVVIEAMQWDGTPEGATPIINWILEGGGTARYYEEQRRGISPFRPGDTNSVVTPAHIIINTLEGAMQTLPADWVIRGVQDEHYPCKPDIFEATYEPVEDES